MVGIRQSWVVEALVLDGDPSDPERGALAKLVSHPGTRLRSGVGAQSPQRGSKLKVASE